MSKDTHETHPAVPEGSGKHAHDDEPIAVPKGSSKTRFLMTALLAVLVLTTFTVSHEVVDVLTGRNSGRTSYMSWKRPSGELEKMSAGDFMMVKQDISRAQSIMSGGSNTKDHDDVQTARHIIENELAKEAGIEVTDDELRKLILPRFGGSPDTYMQILDHYRTTATEFENTLRALIRVNRYISLLSESGSTPDPSTVVDEWRKSHREYSFEAIELETDRFEDEAKAGCPSGDELQKWFDALPEPEKNSCRTMIPAKVSAEFAWFSFDPPTKPDRFLVKFPRPATEKPDDVAQTWYAANKNLLFKKPGLPVGKPGSPDDYLPFEEAKDLAQIQGIANQSANDWLNDMKLREGQGETISLSVEVSSIGLAYRLEPTPRARGEWKGLAMPWSGGAMLDALYAPTAEAGKVLPDVIVDAKGLFVARLVEKQASRMPEFAEFQDKAHDYWMKKKRGELAVAKLDALRAKLPTQPDASDPAATMAVEPDATKWQSAAQELGLEIKLQDWFDAAAPLRPGQVTPLLMYMRQISQRYGQIVGAVPKPELSTDKAKAWLVRAAASRDPGPERLTPLDYQSAQQMASYESNQKFYADTFGSNDYLKQHFGLELEAWRREAADKTPATK